VNIVRDLKYYLPGSILILMALLILVFPAILIGLVAAAFIMIGIGVLQVGHLIRKSEVENPASDLWFFDDVSSKRRSYGSPIFPGRYRGF
jgi:hypothetical protein